MSNRMTIAGERTTASWSTRVDTQSFRMVGGQFATGVAVVTSALDGAPLGTTVNAFTTVSLDPTLLLVCLDNRSRLLAAVQRSAVFAITVLAADQRACAQRFASPGRPRGHAAFDGIPVRPAPATGCSLLSDGIAYFDCTADHWYRCGDHTLLVGRVVSCGLLRPRPPLLFVNQRYAEPDLSSSAEETRG